MGRKSRVRYEERPTRFASGVSAAALLGFLAFGLPFLAIFWFAYSMSHFSLLLIPLGFMVLWNGLVVFGFLYNAYNAATGNAPALTSYERIEEPDDE